MKKVIATYVCFLQDEIATEGASHNVRELNILHTGEVYFRSNDSDGEQRYYTWDAAKFENVFRVNLLNLLQNVDLA